jgi:hypothetical protein
MHTNTHIHIYTLHKYIHTYIHTYIYSTYIKTKSLNNFYTRRRSENM